MTMMNKYTLKFKYQKLEAEYIYYRNQNIKIPIFKAGSIFILCAAFSKMIQLLLDGKKYLIPILLTAQIYSLVSLILLQFKIHKINIQLMILAYILVVYEIIIEEDISREAFQLYSENFTYGYIIIILISEFLDSAIMIASIIIFKLMNTILSDTKKSYPLYATSLVSIFFLCYFSYKANTLSRTNFLLSKQDYMWGIKLLILESIFPKILDKPYIIFQFNEENLEFSFQQSKNLNFNCNSNEQLKQFLRGWKNKQNSSLEFILFQQFKNSKQQETLQNQIEVQSLKKDKLIVKYTIFRALYSSIIMSFEERSIHLLHHVNQIQRIIQVQQHFQENFLNLFYNSLKHYFKYYNEKKLLSLRNSCFLQILNQKVRLEKRILRDINKNDIYEILELFKHKNLQIVIKFEEENSSKFIVSYFQRLLFQILKCSIKKSTIIIKIQTNSVINYSGKVIEQKQSQILSQVWEAQIESWSSMGKFITINFYNEPNVRFLELEI